MLGPKSTFRQIIERASITFCLCVSLFACSGSSSKSAISPNAETYTVKSEAFVDGIEEVGILKATRAKGVLTQMRGKIAKMIPEGEKVKEGDPVVWLDQEEIEKKLHTERIQVKKNQSNLDKRLEYLREARFKFEQIVKEAKAKRDFNKLKVEMAERELESIRERYAKKLIPESDVLTAEADFAREKLLLESSEIGLARAEAQYDSSLKTLKSDVEVAKKEFERSTYYFQRLEKQLEETVIRAPLSGIVLHSKRWNRDKIKEGDQVWWGMQICEIPDLSEMEVRSQVSEANYSDIFNDQNVIVTVNALDNLELKGKVQKISDLAVPRRESDGVGFVSEEENDGGKVFETVISLKSTDERLRPGMGVSVLYVKERLDMVLTAPVSVVTTQKGVNYVYLKNNGTFQRKEIVTSHRNSKKIVISEGLQEGDIVALIASDKTL